MVELGVEASEEEVVEPPPPLEFDFVFETEAGMIEILCDGD